MPLINNGTAKQRANSRSYTNLVRSDGNAPATQYIVDPTLPGLFQYPYANNRYLSKVVVPKGTIVAVTGTAKDYNTLKYRNTLGFAGLNLNGVGVAPYSYFNRFNLEGSVANDQFGAGDFQPVVITRDYLEVPYIANCNDVYTSVAGVLTGFDGVTGMKFNYGCATNDPAHLGLEVALKAGDFVKAGPYGKFVKWIAGVDGAEKIVGQVLELDTDMAPLGWLKYVEQVYEGDMSAREEISEAAAPADGSMVYDPNYKWPVNLDYRSPGAWKQIGEAIPGLTDGGQMSQTLRVQKFTLGDGQTSLVCDLDPAAKVLYDAAELVHYFNVNLENVGDLTTAGANKFAYDASTQRVTITAEAQADDAVVEITYRVDPSSLLGVPASWDHVGSIGVARILLKL